MKDDGSDDRRAERKVKGEWHEQGQMVACEAMKVVSEERVLIYGHIASDS